MKHALLAALLALPAPALAYCPACDPGYDLRDSRPRYDAEDRAEAERSRDNWATLRQSLRPEPVREEPAFAPRTRASDPFDNGNGLKGW